MDGPLGLNQFHSYFWLVFVSLYVKLDTPKFTSFVTKNLGFNVKSLGKQFFLLGIAMLNNFQPVIEHIKLQGDDKVPLSHSLTHTLPYGKPDILMHNISNDHMFQLQESMNVFTFQPTGLRSK